eukprot:scaffold255537_cov37-Tisochrysis_lutea.AAC.1
MFVVVAQGMQIRILPAGWAQVLVRRLSSRNSRRFEFYFIIFTVTVIVPTYYYSQFALASSACSNVEDQIVHS